MTRPDENMECAVCYSETGPFRRLCCGHEFCTGCVKTWYLKGTGTGCPMCRRPIYFKGFHKVRDEWNEEQWRNACMDVLEEHRAAVLEEAQEFLECFGGGRFWDHIIQPNVMSALKEAERTTRFLMAEGIDSDWLAYVLLDTDDYYSDRHVDKFRYYDEPPRLAETRYPKLAKAGAKGARRARALTDPLWTVSIVVLI